MASRTYSVFENAWFLNRTLSAKELRDVVSKLPYTDEVTQIGQGSSKNRLVLHHADEFVFPRFLTRTLGGSIKCSWLYCGFEWHTHSVTALDYMRSLTQHFVDDRRSIAIASSVIIEYFNIELYYEDIPILIKLNPFNLVYDEGAFYDGPVGISVDLLGSNENHDHSGIDLRDSKGVGAALAKILDRFLSNFDDLEVNDSLYTSGLHVQFKISKNSVSDFLGRLIGLRTCLAKISDMLQRPAHCGNPDHRFRTRG